MPSISLVTRHRGVLHIMMLGVHPALWVEDSNEAETLNWGDTDHTIRELNEVFRSIVTVH